MYRLQRYLEHWADRMGMAAYDQSIEVGRPEKMEPKRFGLAILN
jgi:hypothetical protein